jgi:hypothetical protein
VVTYDNGADVPVAAGSYTVRAVLNNDNYAAEEKTGTLVIARAASTTVVTVPTGAVYNGQGHAATAVTTGLNGIELATPAVSYTPGGSEAPVNAGTYTASASFAGNDNYESSESSAQFTIGRAQSATVVSFEAGPYTYRGSAYMASAVVSGVAGLSQDVSVVYSGDCTNVTSTNGCTATATFAGDDNHEGSTDSKNITITKANATVAVQGVTVTYDGQPHGATGSATGVNNEDLSSGLSLGQSFTIAGTHTASWSFDGGQNYESQSGTVEIVINKANATISVQGFEGVYDGTAKGATGSATGIGGVTLAGLDLGQSFTNVPGGTANWSFTDETGNYNDASGSVAIVINKADATVSVSGTTATYDGTAHGATGSARGVNGEDLSAGLSLGDSFTNVPGGTANWSFAGGTNYNDQSGTAAIVVNPAAATIDVQGVTVTYDGNAHGAKGTASGVGGVDLNSYLDLGGSFTNAGTHMASWSFDAGANYETASGTANIVISPATASVTVAGASKVYGAADPVFTGTLDGFVASDGVTATYSRAPGEDAGRYSITAQLTPAAALENYTITINTADLEITPLAIAVTADAKAKTYGDSDPDLTFTFTPALVRKDGFTGALARTEGENAGEYDITQGTLALSDNYTLGFTGAKLTINKAALTVTPANKPIIQGGSVQPLTGSIEGIQFSDNITASYSTTADGMTVGSFPITAVVSDNGTDKLKNYDVDQNTGTLTVTANSKPVITSLVAPMDPKQVGTSSQVQVTFADVDAAESNPYTVTIDWGNGYSDSRTVATPGTESFTYTYPSTGVYRVTVTVKDKIPGSEVSQSHEFIVIYDPNGGFVTGGGWIWSPAGAYVANPSLAGKATFGFNSKYQKGKTVPTGNTEFQFQAGNLNFKSTAYEWLVISGTNKAQFRGTGTINGSGDYTFVLTAIDGEGSGGGKPDAFRIRIWGGTGVVYDNKMGEPENGDDATVLGDNGRGGGSIVIHDGGNGNNGKK